MQNRIAALFAQKNEQLLNVYFTAGFPNLGDTLPILRGLQGTVTQMKFSAGATLTLIPSANASVKGLIWRTSAAKGGNTGTMCFGSRRVVVVGDSSPCDNSTGNPRDRLFPGWTEISSHARLHLNASLWLAQLQ